MPGELNLHALRQETFAATLAAAGENGAAILGLHAGAKAKLLLASALRGLIGAFHRTRALEYSGKKERQDSGSIHPVNAGSAPKISGGYSQRELLHPV